MRDDIAMSIGFEHGQNFINTTDGQKNQMETIHA